MAISFQINNEKLVLCYTPSMGFDDIERRLSSEDGINIKNTFFVTKDLLRENAEEDDSEDTLYFDIGQVENSYIQIDSYVLGTDHNFYFGNEINIKPEMFVAYRNISILRKIDDVIERDFYVGGDWEAHNGISIETYNELLKKFPKTAELDKYAHNRIAIVIKDYFPECDRYEQIYDNFIESKSRINISEAAAPSKYNIKIELEQFSVAYQELTEMLSRYEAIDEKQWQVKIHNILQLLYPKYIFCAREIRFQGIGKYDKQPDFIMVDANGFIDILEIKKADVLLLTKYRNNYVASRELSGAIQQVEKYIFCLNSSNKAKEDVSNKLSEHLPASVKINIVNPQGILILGRSNEFSFQQQQDFELIKRQYKHVADIMTYDDLAQRLKNIIVSLQKRL